jgi:acrylyl-CoA reductase (NADPH)
MPLPQTFKAMIVSETSDKRFIREVKEKTFSQLPLNEVLIEVKYSSLNYIACRNR